MPARSLLALVVTWLVIAVPSVVVADITIIDIEHSCADGDETPVEPYDEGSGYASYFFDVLPGGSGFGGADWNYGANFVDLLTGAHADSPDTGSVGVQIALTVTFQVTVASSYTLDMPASWDRVTNGGFVSTRVEAHLAGPGGWLAGYSWPAAGTAGGSGSISDPPTTGTLQPGVTYTLFVRSVATAADDSDWAQADTAAHLDVTPIP